ncbi:DNA modification methylase [Capsulimonas corticalis]|uniref:DNA modification methylase n=1 Tax=Capsulimonas corticalis TaxID=2219043 RepID=A0A402D3X5_9BACT|nr:DNA adenine methylase [Capsulimonas corticalis]BDI29669.1 DNA modification methylase [Capsulimonas corticalis]
MRNVPEAVYIKTTFKRASNPLRVKSACLPSTPPPNPAQDLDQELSKQFKATLRRVTDSDAAYWDYSSIKSNSNPQAYFQYPAMMVPRMQGDIIDAIQKVFPGTERTFDPFAGSGTILVESLKRGLNSLATDINPMAILLCRVKTQPFRVNEAENAFKEVINIAASDISDKIEIDYTNREKWFSLTSLIELSRIRRAIVRIEDVELRRLLWVAFAEAIRISSNSRTSTYKLHIRDSDDIERRSVGVKSRINTSMTQVIDMYKKNYIQLKEAGILEENHFTKEAKILNHNICSILKSEVADALISSPPYGDNHTTVTYGQHSFLPLCWIPINDIDSSLDATIIANTHSIDSASLGGRREGALTKRSKISERSNTLEELLNNPNVSKDAQQRLSVFFYDLDKGLANAISVLKPKSPIVLTLGNRCVSNQKVRMDKIVEELLIAQGCEFIDIHDRAIPTKRMAHRNQTAGTMLTETLLIMRGPKL